MAPGRTATRPPPSAHRLDSHSGMRKRLEERQALHELVRISHSRVEDLRMLHSVCSDQDQQGKLMLGAAATDKILVECCLREEWRTQRSVPIPFLQSRYHQRERARLMTSFLGINSQVLTPRFCVVREEALISALQGFDFTTCGDDESHQLADQLLALQQVPPPPLY